MNTTTAIANYVARGGDEQTARQIISDAIARGYGLAADLWYYGFTTQAKAQRMADAIEAEAVSA